MINISDITGEYYAMMNSLSRNRRLIILIMALSILLQIFFISNFKANPIESDAIQYNLLAKNLLHSKMFSLDAKTINLTRAPGYPLFIFLIYSVFGERVLAVQLIQVILIALICFFIYRISTIVFDGNVGILAALLIAVNPVFICQSFSLLSETLMAFLMTASVYFAIISMREFKIKYFMLLGIFLGAAALTRPIVLLLPFFSICLLMFFYNWKRVLKFALFSLIPFIIVTGIWVYHDYKYTGYFIPLQIMGGRSLWTGTYVPGEGFDEHPLTIKAREELTERLSIEIKKEHKKLIEEKSPKFDILTLLVVRQMGREGVINIINDPIGIIRILPYKLGRLYIGSYSYLYGVKEKFSELFNPNDYIKNASLKLYIKLLVLIMSIAIIIFSLIGTFFSIFKAHYALPVIILFLYWNLMFIFFDSMSRYSIPILPLIILMAAKGFYFCKRNTEFKRKIK